MEEIKIFNSPQFGEIRTTGTSEQPMFCAADVCKALGYTNPRKAVADHVDEWDVTKRDTPTPSGSQMMTFVNESGLYSLIFGSKLPMAKAFKKWVTSEVLPSIRKTGSYIAGNSGATTSHPTATVKAKIAAAKFLASFLNLNESSKLLIAKSIADPLGLPTPDYTPSHGVLKSASELLKENGSTMSAQAFNARLIELGYLTELSRPSSKGGVKKFKSITAKGLEYGENQVNPNNPKSTQPLWYADRFNEFMNVVR